MTKDMKYLHEFKTKVILNLKSNLKITSFEAEQIFKILEDEDFLRIRAPEMTEKSINVLTSNRHLNKSELGLTSHKFGNIILNTYLDWKQLAGIILSSFETVVSFDAGQPLLIIVGVISSLLSVSNITNIKIDENGTAIIMALQQHNAYKSYSIDEQECKKEANDILSSNGYERMDERKFQSEIDILLKCKCIDEQNGVLKLKEKFVAHY